MAMSSSSAQEFEIEEQGDGESRNTGALNSVEVSSERTDRENQEPRVPDEDLPARDSSFKLFRFFGPCCSCAGSSTNRSWYYSARIQRMMEKRGEISTEVESEIEASKVHWSQMDTDTMSQTEHSWEPNREYYEVLRRRVYVREGDQLPAKQLGIDEETPDDLNLFDDRWNDRLEVGEKLAEGGQAEIYATSHPSFDNAFVVKVFKEGSVLQDLEKQWPPALLKYYQGDERGERLPRNNLGAMLLKDERFAFVMWRHWGDLWKLIDRRMMEVHNQGPPFTLDQVLHLMRSIADDMNKLHKQNPPILHNDLKAANVLVYQDNTTGGPYVYEYGRYLVTVIDFECSVGVVGTGLCRAPEILQQLKARVSMSDLVFTKECDVYSYGMTCYELVSGCIPFENCIDQLNKGCDLVLKGERPKLPPRLHPLIKQIITSCWHPIP